MPRLCTYITFPGNAEEVFSYYRDVFGGELEILHYSDMPPMEEMSSSAPAPNAVAYASLALPGGAIAGEDSLSPSSREPGSSLSYSLMYELDEVSTAETLFSKLLEGGGSAVIPFALAPWGHYFGTVRDKFGIVWSFNAPAQD